MQYRRSAALFIFAFLFVLTDVAVSTAKKPATVAELALYTGADRQQILEEGARKEGKLTLYTTEILTQTVRPKVAAFQKKHPYIKVEIWRASTNELLPKVFEEYGAGRHVVDIIEISQNGEMLMEERGIFQPFYSPNLAYVQEAAIRKTPGGGVFSAGLYESGLGVCYNIKLITREELPKTYPDLLDPKWKGNGKVAIGSDTSGSGWMQAMLVTYGEDFVRRMAKQDFALHTVTSAAIRDMVINGEYVLSPSVFEPHVSESKKNGAPIDWVPLEPVYTNLGQITLSKHSAYPHAALLYIDFSLSKEAGEIYKSKGYVSPRMDVPGGTTYKKYYGPFSTKQFAQWNQLFNQLFLKK